MLAETVMKASAATKKATIAMRLFRGSMGRGKRFWCDRQGCWCSERPLAAGSRRSQIPVTSGEGEHFVMGFGDQRLPGSLMAYIAGLMMVAV